MNKNSLLSPIKYVVDNSESVGVDEGRVGEFARNYVPVEAGGWLEACPFEYKGFEDVRDEIDFWFLADSQAFCFWGFPQKWTVKYQGMELDGWWAMLACLKRAHEKGVPIFEGEWLAGLTLDEVKELFEGKPQIQLDL